MALWMTPNPHKVRQAIKSHNRLTAVRRSERSLDGYNRLADLVDGDAYYISAGNLSANCTWLYLNSSAFKGQGYNTTMPGFGTPSFTPSLPDCRAGNFTEQVFQVNGTVCDFAQLMNLIGV